MLCRRGNECVKSKQSIILNLAMAWLVVNACIYKQPMLNTQEPISTHMPQSVLPV